MSTRDVAMVITHPGTAVSNMNGGDRSNEDRNISEIMPVSTMTITHPMPASNTLANLPAPAISPLPILSPSMLAAKHKEEEKRIQAVMLFCELKQIIDPRVMITESYFLESNKSNQAENTQRLID